MNLIRFDAAMLRRLLVPVLLVAILAAGLAMTIFGSGGETVYLTAPVKRDRIQATITAVGTVNPVGTVEVGSQISGQISELLVDFNARVEEGQPLARLDSETFEANVREAEAELDIALSNVQMQEASLQKSEAELATSQAGRVVIEARSDSNRSRMLEAKRELERKRTLRAKGTVAQAQVDKAEADYLSALADLKAEEAQGRAGNAEIRAAEASLRVAETRVQNAMAELERRQAVLDRARIELARATVRAPIDGLVIDRSVELGQTVAASLQAPKLFTIAEDLGSILVEAFVDEADIGQVRLGQTCLFTVDAFPDRRFEGQVSQIRKSPRVFENVVTYTVIVSARNPELLLLPGMTANVELIVMEAVDALTVANAALRFEPEESGNLVAPDGSARVWLLGDDGTPIPVPVETGLSDGRSTEIVSGGLSEESRTIVSARPDGSRHGFFDWLR